MLIILGFVVFLCLVLLRFCCSSCDQDVAMFPGSWPLVGHMPLLFRMDGVKILEFLKSLAKFALENDGYCKIMFGPFKYYILAEPDDCSTLLSSTVEKNYLYTFGQDWLGNGLLTGDFNTWKAHRKIMNPMFSQQSLNTFMPIFNKQARRLVERFSSKVGPFNHENDVFVVGLETIFQTTLGSDEEQQKISTKNYLDAVNNAFGIIMQRAKLFWYHNKSLFNRSSLKKEMDVDLNVIHQYSNKLIQKRKLILQSEPNVNDEDVRPFIDPLLKLQEENIFTEKEVRDEVNTLIVAGYETTSTALNTLLMVLGHHKDVQEKIYQEINEVFNCSECDVDKSDLAKLVYMEAVIKETLRYYSLVTLIGRQVTSEIKLGKLVLKPGDQCLIMMEGIHRHPQWGSDVNQYRPERWLSPDTLPKNPNLFVPFGFGKRHCIGKTYAMMSMKTTLVHVLRHYKISCNFSKVLFKMEVLTKAASGQHISIEQRRS